MRITIGKAAHLLLALRGGHFVMPSLFDKELQLVAHVLLLGRSAANVRYTYRRKSTDVGVKNQSVSVMFSAGIEWFGF